MNELNRRDITFEQAEGVVPLPSQLQLRNVSKELRAWLWLAVHTSMVKDIEYPTMGGHSYFGTKSSWKALLMTWHVERLHRYVDEFQDVASVQIAEIKKIITNGDYVTIFGFLEFLIRHRSCPRDLPFHIEDGLKRARAAYRIQDQSIIPIASEAEVQAIEAAFDAMGAGPYKGAKVHLLKAGEALTAGKWAESVRESIHAVESLVAVLEPGAGSISKALSRLENSKRIHPALKSGFGSLYGYSSDEEGIRHPLVDEPVAHVDETDAMYMFGSCAAFITYLIGKAAAPK